MSETTMPEIKLHPNRDEFIEAGFVPMEKWLPADRWLRGGRQMGYVWMKETMVDLRWAKKHIEAIKKLELERDELDPSEPKYRERLSKINMNIEIERVKLGWSERPDQHLRLHPDRAKLAAAGFEPREMWFHPKSSNIKGGIETETKWAYVDYLRDKYDG